MIIPVIVYLAVGFLVMTVCAKFGWMNKYDPPLMYWIGWPLIIMFVVVMLAHRGVEFINNWTQTYVDTLKPERDKN